MKVRMATAHYFQYVFFPEEDFVGKPMTQTSCIYGNSHFHEYSLTIQKPKRLKLPTLTYLFALPDGLINILIPYECYIHK